MNYLIPSQNVSNLIAKIEKLARKAEKLGCEKPTYVVGSTEFIKKIDENREVYYVQYTNIDVDGVAPSLNGWKFIGTIEAVDNASIVKSVPGYEIPDSYRYVNPCACDHCGINRYRTETFIVRSEQNEHKQVGRSCLKDFLGHASPEQYAQYASMLIELQNSSEDSDSDSGSYITGYSVKEIVAAAHFSINAWGYRKSEFENSTRGTVCSHLFTKKQDEKFSLTQENFEIATAAIEWMTQQSGSEFLNNLAVYSKQEIVKSNAIGYLCAGVMMYLRALDQLKAVKSKKDGVVSGIIGAIGQKIEARCTVISAKKFERQSYSYYDSGVSQVLILKTENGNLIKMFSSNLYIQEDDVVIVSGKIKDATPETFERSPFKGFLMTSMMPRARITVQ
jgi:hypothetical protein